MADDFRTDCGRFEIPLQITTVLNNNKDIKKADQQIHVLAFGKQPIIVVEM
jgi:hypothetical protein